MIRKASRVAEDTMRNQENNRTYCRFAVDTGYVPIAPHIYFPQFMNDRSSRERELTLFMAAILPSKCTELWVFGEEITGGMSIEIRQCLPEIKPKQPAK